MKSIKVVLTALIISTFLMSFTSAVKKWDFLGQKKVNYTIDRDEIRVTAREGALRKLKLHVKKAPVHFRKVVVHYRNGSAESIQMRDNVGPGGETRAIDLNGNRRIVTKVVFYYNTKKVSSRKGIVKLYGMN